MIRKLLVAFCLLPMMAWSQNQEIATFVSYNLLNYRNETSFCTNSNNSPVAKEGYFKTIFAHIQPDLIACNEIGSNPTSAVKILEKCLNVDGETKYQMASFSSTSGSDLSNAFYYNGDMFTIYETDKILNDAGGSSLTRLIDVFTLYYNDANLPLGADTTFLTVFVAHLKAGNSSADASKRALATEALMNYIDTESIMGNYIFAGDFNVYKSTETAFQNLINPTPATIKFNDPINRLGDWNNEGAFADVHTQSTHATSAGCHSGGGLDDRFDFVLISDAIVSDDNRMKFVNGSYKAVANDGNHFNQSINSGTNNSVLANVLTAIYEGSDHLPVVMDMVLTEAEPNSITEIDEKFQVEVINPSSGGIQGSISGQAGMFDINVYSVTGKLLVSKKINVTKHQKFEIPVNLEGMVLLEFKSENGYRKIVKVIQN